MLVFVVTILSIALSYYTGIVAIQFIMLGRYPITTLYGPGGRYDIQRQALYNRIAFLNIETTREGKYCYISEKDVLLLDELDLHIRLTGQMDGFESTKDNPKKLEQLRLATLSKYDLMKKALIEGYSLYSSDLMAVLGRKSLPKDEFVWSSFRCTPSMIGGSRVWTVSSDDLFVMTNRDKAIYEFVSLFSVNGKYVPPDIPLEMFEVSDDRISPWLYEVNVWIEDNPCWAFIAQNSTPLS